ncbi:hypothetical protein [Brevundimonas sp.]|uniref:hypothetical protein n=1 Tax=Brevundimonas sp. TaxID=1871086 RepID=UPI003D6CA9C4
METVVHPRATDPTASQPDLELNHPVSDLLILGDSHTTAIARAYKTRGGEIADRDVSISRYQIAKGE